MGSYKIRRLGLPENIVEILEKQKLHSCKDVLTLTRIELQNLLGINLIKATELQTIISKKCVAEPDTVYSLYMHQRKCLTNGFFPTSVHFLDMLLQGGLPIGNLTEIAGPPGVGKTQFCFMLSILATLPLSDGGLNSQVIYIDTESAFNAGRLKNMAQKRFPDLFQTEYEIKELLKHISVCKASSTSVLKEIIFNVEDAIIKNGVKLIIVDSIASLMRKEYGAANIESLMERNKILLKQAAVLKDVAQTFGVVVFLTNQVTSHTGELDSILPDNIRIDYNEEERAITCDSTEGFSGSAPPAAVPRKKMKLRQGVDAHHVIPALGATWSHCVNTRLVAQFVDPSVRQLTIVKSPVAPNAAVRYILDESGVVLTDHDIEFVSLSEAQHQTIRTKYNFLSVDVTGTGKVFTSGLRRNDS